MAISDNNPNQSPKVIGVFGGTFDPVHLGHIKAITTCLTDFNLDKVVVIPCHDPVHKPDAFVKGKDRLKMLELAFAQEHHIEISDIELVANQGSYTVDTLALLKDKNPADHLVFAMGSDSYLHLHTWHRVDKILSLAHIVVLSRPGHSHQFNGAFKQSKTSAQVNKSTVFLHQSAGEIILHPIDALDISSTQVRKRLQTQMPVEKYLAPEVIRYIEKASLYKTL